MSQQSNRPAKVFRAGNMRASIWRNQVQVNGRPATRHSLSIEKRFRDREGQWKSSRLHAFADDLPKLEVVIREAYAYCVMGESQGASGTDAEA